MAKARFPESAWATSPCCRFRPVLFDSKVPDSDNLRISKDRKSLIHKNAGWTWTFTPSVKP